MCADDGSHFRLGKMSNGWTVGKFSALEDLAGVVHLVTTRDGPDVESARDEPRTAARAVREALGLSAVAYCEQAHGKAILCPRRGGRAGRGDGLITSTASIGLMGLSADCPLILVCDPVSGAVGMAHASWRGTVRRIASELVIQLVGRYMARPADVIACIGPSAGPCCYEVGADVFQLASVGLGLRAEQYFQKRDGKTYFDMWAGNVDELLEAGLARENVHAAGVCTICRNDVFPSYRAEGTKAGRFVAVIARL